MRPRRAWIVAGAGLVVVGAAFLGATATASSVADWKGGESFSGVALEPDPECGSPAAQSFRLRLTGTGIDSVGGVFAVEASACVNLETRRVTDLEATDTFVRTRDTLTVQTDDFTLEVDEDPSRCVAKTARSIRFRIVDASGGMEGTKGSGHFDMAMSWPTCGGPHPAHVWFRGELTVPD